ncbi:MAG: response regulator transcription factor [Ignavibacteriales bacterium]|nr:response regulator transcription factor [Ignavibacteriota bacterium]MCB9219921.1 response regulator transcription factor [Ignavibacteriales bacterium]MCB9250155.1 response regulator transcription factor [Ignavibacteriales bacterium]
MISVDIIEDIEEIRNTVSEFIGLQPELLMNTAAASVEEYLVKQPTELNPDVIILDIGLPGISGLSAIEIIKKKLSNSEIILFTIHDEPSKIFDALKKGASGYILKSTPLLDIKRAIIEVANNGAPMSPSIAKSVIEYFNQNKPIEEKSILTKKEKIVLKYLADGQSYKMIAANCNNSLETIKFHLKNIYKKLHVNSNTEAIAKLNRGEI